MKAGSRKWMRVLVAAAVIIPVLLALCLDGLDYDPYFRAPYYQETLARFQVSVATNQIAVAGLSAGFGRVRLTPEINAAEENPSQGQFRAVPLAGYGNRKGAPATGVHDELWIKAVALRVGETLGVIFGADALIVPREVADAATERLQNEFGLLREQLYFSATHTHCSLGGWGEGMVGEAFAGKFDPGARNWFTDRIVAAAREAISDLKPAQFGHGSFMAPEFVRNRLVGDLGRVDPEFSYALLQQTGGRMTVLGSYSAHATVLSARVMEFSGDYPGFWQQAVEDATGGMAVFLAGAVGSHGPVPGEPGFKGAELMGWTLAEKLLERLPSTPLTNSIPFGFLGLEVSLPPLHVRVSDRVRMRPWASAHLLPVSERSFVQGFRLGSSVWLSTPCDFSGELALDVKNSLRVRGFSAIITSFNGDYIGYVIPAHYYHLGGYEPRVMSFYGPYMADYLDELIRTLALELTSD